MTLHQLASVKQWHLAHPSGHVVEGQVWDGVLSAWILGWIGLPPAWILGSAAMAAGCAVLVLLPRGYLGLRRRLHRRGMLRCDWLVSLSATAR
jgi:hypothetical protein